MRRLLLTVLASSATACASTGAVPQPFPVPGNTPVTSPAPPPPESVPAPTPTPASGASNGYAISGSALLLRGTPYKNGGHDPSGFDCSGFVWFVFDQNGVRVPRTVSELFRTGSDVDPADLRAGDLVFFDTVNGLLRQSATHVGISIGGDEFVHAPSTTGEVRVERLGSNYWAPRFVGARRMP
jgi:peptidoglycan DL-endopeptidase LytE